MLRVNRLSLGIVLLCFTTTAFGQVERATISGKVADNSGALISGADVEITSLEHGTTTHTVTNGSGIYLFPAVQPGRYNIEVRHDGFRQIDALGLTVNVQDHVEENFQMQVGSSIESITVNAESATLDTQDASVSTVIDRNFAENLPLNGRTFNTLMQLTPGVVIAPTVQGFNSGQFSIAGQRQDANNFTIDGVSANFGTGGGFSIGPTGAGNSQAFSALGGTSSLVSVEALEEFRIETSSASAEFGRNTGGQVVLTTRSGTNVFHGGVYEYFRNDVLDSNDWFLNEAGKPRASKRHNDFGGFLGGPIWKDKTFFFISYEGARLRLPQSMVVQVPSEFARTSAPSALAPFLDAFPEPDNLTVTPGVWTAPFTGGFSNSSTLNAGSVRVDHKFNDHLSIFGRYNQAPSDIVLRASGLSTLNPESVNTKTITVGADLTPDSRKTNAIRVNYSTQDNFVSTSLDSFGGAQPLSPTLLLGLLSPAQNNGIFETFDTNAVQLGPAGDDRTRQFNLVDDFYELRGTHQLKFGGDYRAILLDRNPARYQIFQESPSVQQFVTNGTVSVSAVFSAPQKLLTQALSIYGQDTWNPSPRLTLSYGLRWEWDPAPSPRGNTELVSWRNTSDPSQISIAPQGTPVWNSVYTNFAPRLGINYRLTQSGSLVVRAGGGVFYDIGIGNFAGNLGFPNLASSFPQGVSVPVPDFTPFLPPPPSLNPPYTATVYGYANNFKLPRSYQWNLAFEKSLGANQAFTITYLGQAGRDLSRQEAHFQPNSNFQSEFLLTNNSAWSNYDALQAQYRRPLSKRIQGLLNYSWSHSLDNASNDVADVLPSNIISAARDYASSDFDVRQSFSGAITFNVPGLEQSRLASTLSSGWSLDTVIVARTGFPFNGQIFTINPDPGFFATIRPDIVPGQPLYLSGANCASTFQGLGVLSAGQVCPGGKGLNPAAFSVQSTPRQGTEPRNSIPGFGLTQVDLSLQREFPLTERVRLKFRTDAFNLFNHPNFANPSALIDLGSPFLLSMSMLNQGLGGGLNPLFQEGGPRSLQLSLKLDF